MQEKILHCRGRNFPPGKLAQSSGRPPCGVPEMKNFLLYCLGSCKAGAMKTFAKNLRNLSEAWTSMVLASVAPSQRKICPQQSNGSMKSCRKKSPDIFSVLASRKICLWESKMEWIYLIAW